MFTYQDYLKSNIALAGLLIVASYLINASDLINGELNKSVKKIEPNTGLCYASEKKMGFPFPQERKSYLPCTTIILNQIQKAGELKLDPGVQPVRTWANPEVK